MVHDLQLAAVSVDIIGDAPTPRDRQYHAQQQHSHPEERMGQPTSVVGDWRRTLGLDTSRGVDCLSAEEHRPVPCPARALEENQG